MTQQLPPVRLLYRERSLESGPIVPDFPKVSDMSMMVI